MFDNNDQVLVHNILGKDITFKYDGQSYTIGKDDIVPLPGYMAKFAVKRLVDSILVREDNRNLIVNVSNYTNSQKLRPYVDRVVHDVRKTITPDNADRKAEEPVKLRAWKGDKEIGGDLERAAKNAKTADAPEVDLSDTKPLDDERLDKTLPETDKSGRRLEPEQTVKEYDGSDEVKAEQAFPSVPGQNQ